jgi:hypothetical protein
MLKNKIQIILKWGVYFGIALCLFDIAKLLTRDIQYPFAPIFSILLLAIIITMLLLGTKQYRENVCGGTILYFKAYGVGTLITLIAVVFYFIFLIFYYQYIDKEGIERINKKNEENFSEKIKNDTISTLEISEYLALLNEEIDSHFREVNVENVDSVKFQEFSEQLQMKIETELYAEKKQKDSTNLMFKNFDDFVRSCMKKMTDETLLSVSDSSTVFRQKVLLVVNNVEDSMAKFSTLSLKVDKERDKIPHYDNKFNVILITALLILIYSLFVNIFTALYVYRNKPARLIGHTQQ